MVPDGLVAQLAQRGQLRVDLVQARPGGTQQPLARLGRRDAAGGAGQQPQAKPRLEPAHGLAQRRLRDAELRGGTGEAPLPRHGEEGDDVIQVRAGHSEGQLIGSFRF